MNHQHIRFVVAAISVIFSTSLFAEAQFWPRATVGYAQHQLSIKTTTAPTSTSDIDATYTKAGVGGTITSGNWYYDGAYETSVGADAEEEPPLTSKYDFKRTDLTLTAGYFLENSFTVFGGIKLGSSEYTENSLSEVTELSVIGPFAGVGYSIPVGDNSISINAALAILSGEITLADGVNPDLEFESISAGLSVGAGYNIVLSDKQGLVIKGNYQIYNASDWEEETFGALNIETEETILSFNLDYYRSF